MTGARRYCGVSGSIIGGIDAARDELVRRVGAARVGRVGVDHLPARWVAQLKSRADSASERIGVASVTTARP